MAVILKITDPANRMEWSFVRRSQQEPRFLDQHMEAGRIWASLECKHVVKSSRCYCLQRSVFILSSEQPVVHTCLFGILLVSPDKIKSLFKANKRTSCAGPHASKASLLPSPSHAPPHGVRISCTKGMSPLSTSRPTPGACTLNSLSKGSYAAFRASTSFSRPSSQEWIGPPVYTSLGLRVTREWLLMGLWMELDMEIALFIYEHEASTWLKTEPGVWREGMWVTDRSPGTGSPGATMF